MSARESIISSPVYDAFRNLPPKGWMSIVRLYEAKRGEVDYLPPIERMEVMAMYLEALHELRDYSGIGQEVDHLVYLCLSDEIPVDRGRAYYEEALFWKANAALYTRDYKQSRHILCELSKLNGSDDRYRQRLRKALYMDKPFWLRYSKALAVLCVLLAIAVLLMEILVFSNFYPEVLPYVRYLRGTFIIGAVAMYVLPECRHRLLCFCKVRRV